MLKMLLYAHASKCPGLFHFFILCPHFPQHSNHYQNSSQFTKIHLDDQCRWHEWNNHTICGRGKKVRPGSRVKKTKAEATGDRWFHWGEMRPRSKRVCLPLPYFPRPKYMDFWIFSLAMGSLKQESCSHFRQTTFLSVTSLLSKH